jgi:pimeloyl-ACP methyl ester carboxylesterase
MKTTLLRSLLALGLAALAAFPLRAADTGGHETFVLVHGSWGGGWAFKEVDRMLTADGHKVYRPTLTGLGEKVHLANRDINLTTHINDIVNVVLFEDLHDIVLVGHSYGGMVITGVMDRIPERIKRVVFLDATVPNDGESSYSVNGRTLNEEEIRTGFNTPEWVKPNAPLPHDVPHPVKTKTEPVSYKNPAALKLPVTYVLFVDPGKTPEQDEFFKFAQRANARGWRVETIMNADHNLQWKDPKGWVELVERAAKP